MSRLGFGGAPIGNLFRPVTDAVAHATVQAVLRAGIRHVDTAPHYGFGMSEKRLGASLAHADPQREVVLSTKVGRRLEPRPDADLTQPRQGFVSIEPFESVFDYSYAGVMHSYEESRARLRREIDVLYVHDLGRRVHGERHPVLFKQFMDEGYRAMRELRDAGAVGAIGLGVNEWQVCEEALGHGDFDLVLLAGRYTLLEQGALDTFLPLCERRRMSVVVGGPYNSGILVRGVRNRNASTYDYQQPPPDVLARVTDRDCVRSLLCATGCGGTAVSARASSSDFCDTRDEQALRSARRTAVVRYRHSKLLLDGAARNRTRARGRAAARSSMILASTGDFWLAAKRRLPRFVFAYLDSAAGEGVWRGPLH